MDYFVKLINSTNERIDSVDIERLLSSIPDPPSLHSELFKVDDNLILMSMLLQIVLWLLIGIKLKISLLNYQQAGGNLI